MHTYMCRSVYIIYNLIKVLRRKSANIIWCFYITVLK